MKRDTTRRHAVLRKMYKVDVASGGFAHRVHAGVADDALLREAPAASEAASQDDIDALFG